MNAIEKLTEFLAKASNAHLALSLEKAIIGEGEDAKALRGIERHIRDEARHRVGPQADKAADADRDSFNAKHGLREDMSEEELDAIYDQIAEEDFVPGEWFYLVAELRK